ncbi:MAG: transglycosylase SLT domain-containing protein [Rhodocyclales bacterium]|nr:transglycosylase SLT domain-containing protein [Rhodocyclales bacterium]
MRSLLAAILLLQLAACGEPPLPPPAQLGKLVVVTREGPATYQVDGNGKASGFEHDLVVLFAQELGVEARFILAHDNAGIARILDKGRAHLAAATLAPADHPALRFSRPIGELKQIPAPLDDAFPDEAGDFDGRAVVASSWAFPANGDASLPQRVEAFLERLRRDGTLDRLVDRYFGHVHRLSAGDVERFLERMHGVLPHYRRFFIEAQDIHGIDWRLLAALAYQESQWDPLATSWTNVRGMMMLTEDTADRLRVTDRLDARQSTLAGARYLAELREQFPPEVAEPDRTWLALAAYNLGMGHMNGARFIAQLVKRDPNSWYEMKQVLPLLAKPEYYSRLKSGAARGGEAVIMTENIRTYYDILQRYGKARVSPQAFSISSSPAM